jgi:hypothetical protein
MSSDSKIDVEKLDKVNMPFIENQGQVDKEVKFYASTFAGTVFVTESGLTYALFNGAKDDDGKGLAVRETFLTKALHPIGGDKGSTFVNYFVGEEENWRSNIPTYDTITLGYVWPSVDVELRAYGKNIEKVFKVAPGGSTENIRLAVEGVRSLDVNEEGELLLETELGTFAMTKPLAYQDIDDVRKSVAVSYSVDSNTYGFAVGQYDPRYTLVIDPLLASTFIGGSSEDQARGIAIDSLGNVFVTGLTSSSNYPTTLGAFDTSHNGGRDVFVSKLASEPLVGPPQNLSLNPKTATNTVGTEHCIIATVTDASGNPVPAVTVVFSVTGSNMDGGSVTTDANGQAQFCYTGELFGEDAITAFADTNNNSNQDLGEPFDVATKTWTLPVSTALCSVTVTQGGQITADNGDRATFGGNAQVSASGVPMGEEEYQDHGPAQPMNVKSISVLAVVCSDDLTTASIFGEATIDGSGSFKYLIQVEDHGEPGTNDTYRILLSNGYDSGRHNLEGGNVQIHK